MLKFVFSRRKVDAIFKRETAMACADPHQVIAIKLSLVHLESGILAYIISFLFLFQVTWLLLDNIHEQIRERNSPRRETTVPMHHNLLILCFPLAEVLLCCSCFMATFFKFMCIPHAGDALLIAEGW